METSGKMFVKRVDLLLFQQGKNRAALSRDLDICLTNMQYAKVSDRKKVEAVASLPKLTDTHED